MLIGFESFKNSEGIWNFVASYKTFDDIQNAFMTKKQGMCVTWSLHCLTRNHTVCRFCIVPHNNKSTIFDMEDWIGSTKDT